MLKLNFGRRPRANFRLGDIFNDLYFPCVLLGRTEAYVRDIELLISEVIEELDTLGQVINYFWTHF